MVSKVVYAVSHTVVGQSVLPIIYLSWFTMLTLALLNCSMMVKPGYFLDSRHCSLGLSLEDFVSCNLRSSDFLLMVELFGERV